MQLQQGQGLTLAGGYGARRDVQGLGGLRQGEALEVAQYHHRPQLTGQACDGLPQGERVEGLRRGLGQLGHRQLPLPAAQLGVAGVDEDAGHPGGEILRLTEAFVVEKALVDRLVHCVHGAGLAAQIEPGGAVEPAFQALRLLNEFLFGQGWRPLSAY